MSADLVLQAADLVKDYPMERGVVLRRHVGRLRAVDGVSFTLERGRTLALVGESGCGKSTVGRLLAGLEAPTSGSVIVEGQELPSLRPRDLRRVRRTIQMIFQDPYASLDPRMTVGSIIGEPIDVHPDVLPAGHSKHQAVAELMDQVGLNRGLVNRYPHQFSGGERQRVGIARALALKPSIIVADEPVSALDVSVQAQVMNLLMDLRDEHGLSYVFISHDLAVVRQIADSIAVMYLGRIVEVGPAETIYRNPRHPYTHALLAAVPVTDPVDERARERIRLVGDLPSPVDPPSGCGFRTRCWKAQQICSSEQPQLLPTSGGGLVACHFPEPA